MNRLSVEVVRERERVFGSKYLFLIFIVLAWPKLVYWLECWDVFRLIVVQFSDFDDLQRSVSKDVGRMAVYNYTSSGTILLFVSVQVSCSYMKIGLVIFD